MRKFGSHHWSVKLSKPTKSPRERAGGRVGQAEVDREERAARRPAAPTKMTAGAMSASARKRRSSRRSRRRRRGARRRPPRARMLTSPVGFEMSCAAMAADRARAASRRSTRTGRARSTTLDLEIDDGELVVFVGPSGLRQDLGAAHDRRARGDHRAATIRIGDQVVNDLPPKDRDIAMIFQNYALYPHMSRVRQHGVRAQAAESPKAEIDRRVRDAARVLGLDEVLAKKPRTLSGGQRQRVAMGRAIVREPQAFLMDEPLSNLDAKLRVQMRAEIARLQRDLEVTTIYVTHDQTEAMTLGDRVAVMRDGVLQQLDRPQSLYRPAGQPLRRRVHRLARDEPRRGGARAGDAGALRRRTRCQLDIECSASYALRGPQGGARDPPGGPRGRGALGRARGQPLPARSTSRGHGLGGLPPLRRRRAARRHRGRRDAVEARRPSRRSRSRRRAAGTPFVARIGRESTAGEGDRIEVAVDTRRLHFFDLETGDALAE